MTRQTRAGYSTTRLLREFDHVVKQVKPVLLNYHALNADTVIQESWLEFEQLIPRLPSLGGKRNPLTWNLIALAWYWAFYKGLRRGEIPEALAKLRYATFEFYRNKTPKLLFKLMGCWKFTPFAKTNLKNRAAKSQQRHDPQDFVFFLVEGDGKTFDGGVDDTECALCKPYPQEGAENFTRYLGPLNAALRDGWDGDSSATWAKQRR